MKTEIWNGHEIRFVEIDSEWWAIAKDVSSSLGYGNTRDSISRHVDTDNKTNVVIHDGRQNRKMTVINEFGIYELVISSKLDEAKQFKRWIFDIIKQLRESASLEGFEIFRMLDREHQREQMSKLCRGLKVPKKSMFIKANMITNKAISIIYGFPKAIKKKDMTPEMLAKREPILEEVVGLMEVNDRYDLGISVSQKVYEKAVK